ncbi:hypothetical protein [Paenibacillus daejeonensis]|uniref:hypothetical protein n=1 Tax=Paenibacillus daejeonensis TaxID=135193 RepID=UPI00036EF583|nr:hypothetical protein [Paenibacillus daejeonensis]
MKMGRWLILALSMLLLLGACSGEEEGSTEENKPTNEEWSTYSNSRFGFTVDYPAAWELGKESDNGDGVQITHGDEVTVLAYASLFNEEMAPDLSQSEPTTLDNDRDANLFVTKDNNTTNLQVVFILDDRIQYNLDITASTAYYETNRDQVDRMIASLDFFEGTEG